MNPSEHDTAAPEVSVIVIGRNEGERLTRCLASIRAMRFPQDRLELLYVDSHSTDDSVRRATDQGARTIMLPAGPPTAARGRNEGGLHARGEYLLFLDGDTIVTPDFLSHALTFLQARPEFAVYFGHRRELHPEHSLYNRVFDLDWCFPCGEYTYCGGDFVIRSTVFRDVGGFRDDIIAGEDAELGSRIRGAGHKLWHADELMTQHDIAIRSFTAYWLRCYRGGHAFAQVSDRTNGEHFKRESVRNYVQTAVYATTPLVLMMLLGMKGLWVSVIAFAMLIARTIVRNRWRKASLATTALYALHVHLCQFPIMLGQLSYVRNRRRAVLSEIIEYK